MVSKGRTSFAAADRGAKMRTSFCDSGKGFEGENELKNTERRRSVAGRMIF